MKTKHHIILSAPVTQSGDQTLSNSIRRKWFALSLGGFLFTSIFALSAPPVEAQCKQWNVGNAWAISQGKEYINVNLSQSGKTVTGSAVPLIRYEIGQTTAKNGSLEGTVEGDNFNAQIYWTSGEIGVYQGKIGPSGRIEGTGYEKRSPSKKVIWFSNRAMKCADAKVGAGAPDWMKAAPKSPPPPRGVVPGPDDYKNLQDEVNKASSKAKPATTPTQLPVYSGSGSSGSGTKGGFFQLHTPTPAPKVFTPTQGEAGKSTRPYIRALPQIVSIPRGESEALTKLVWFAGNDHPDAQLVVAVNGGDERLVDSQRKGSRQVKVKAGQRYVYTLSDAGEPLASVVVQTDQSARPDRQRLRGDQREGRQDGESDNDENQEGD